MKPLDITVADFVTRLCIAALLGIAIGFERQWRQRAAGLHTSSLVAVGASLFALLDTALGTADTTRIVAGVVTGVGFIAGGVILRSGVNVTGLNTAATMWATAAVGALAGFGLWWAALAGAIGVILLNLVLQPIVDAINARTSQMQTGETVYEVSVLCRRDGQSAVRDAVLKAVSGSSLALRSLVRRHAENELIELDAEILSPKPANARIDELSTLLLSLPDVEKSSWRNPSD